MKKTILKNTSTEISKLVFFIWLGFFVTLILSYTPILNILNNIFSPLLNFLGLSKKTTLPILLALTGNIYLALGSALVFTFKIKQWILLGITISLCQSLVPFTLRLFRNPKQIYLFITINLVILITVIKIWGVILFGLNYEKQIGISTQIASLKGGDTILINSLFMYFNEILRISIYVIPVIIVICILKNTPHFNETTTKSLPHRILAPIITNNYIFLNVNTKTTKNGLPFNKYLIIYMSSNILLEFALFFPYLNSLTILIVINKLIIISLIKLLFSKYPFQKSLQT